MVLSIGQPSYQPPHISVREPGGSAPSVGSTTAGWSAVSDSCVRTGWVDLSVRRRGGRGPRPPVHGAGGRRQTPPVHLRFHAAPNATKPLTLAGGARLPRLPTGAQRQRPRQDRWRKRSGLLGVHARPGGRGRRCSVVVSALTLPALLAGRHVDCLLHDRPCSVDDHVFQRRDPVPAAHRRIPSGGRGGPDADDPGRPWFCVLPVLAGALPCRPVVGSAAHSAPSWTISAVQREYLLHRRAYRVRIPEDLLRRQRVGRATGRPSKVG